MNQTRRMAMLVLPPMLFAVIILAMLTPEENPAWVSRFYPPYSHDELVEAERLLKPVVIKMQWDMLLSDYCPPNAKACVNLDTKVIYLGRDAGESSKYHEIAHLRDYYMMGKTKEQTIRHSGWIPSN